MSKLGPHVLGGSSAAAAMIDAGCKVVKLVSDFGLAARAVSKGAIVIGRAISVYPNQDGRVVTAESMRHLNPIDAAILFVNLQSETYRLNPLIKIWEGPNEPVWAEAGEGGEADMDWYGEFESERLRRLSSLGLRGVVGNFSVGRPDVRPGISLWEHFFGAVREAIRLDGILGLHEYSSPWMWWMAGSFQKSTPISEWRVWPGADGWVTLRYRKVLNVLKAAGLESIKIAITELGLDRVSPVPLDTSSGNWRTNARWWGQWNGSTDPIVYWREGGSDAERYYFEQLKWYDNEIKRDPQVIGATIFTCGHDNPAWADYDIEGTRVASFLADYIRNDPDVILPPPPIVQENIMITFDPAQPKENQVITIAVTSDVGHTNVDLRVNGISAVSKSLTGSGPWTWTWEVGPSMAGSYVVKFVADPDGKVHQSASLVVEPVSSNLYRNPNYQGGYHALIGPNGEVLDNKRVPNGWDEVWMATKDTPRLEGQDETQFWLEPEMEIKEAQNVHVSDNDGTAVVHTGIIDSSGHEITRQYVLFDLTKSNQKRWQIFKGSGRVWVRVGGGYTLRPDDYRLEFNVFPDIAGKTAIEGNVLHKYLTMDGRSLDVLNGEARVVVEGDGGSIVAASEWKNGITLPYCQWGVVGIDFTLHATKEVVVYLELRCRWGVPTVGWFLGDVSLTKSTVLPPPPPSEMPVIEVTPGGPIKSGDTVTFAITGDVPYTNIGLEIMNRDPSGEIGPTPIGVSLTGTGPWTWTFNATMLSGQWYVSFFADPNRNIYKRILINVENVNPPSIELAELTERVVQLEELVTQIDTSVDVLTSRVDDVDGRVIDQESKLEEVLGRLLDLEQRIAASERNIIQKIRDALSGILGR